MKMLAFSVVASIVALTTRVCYGELQPDLDDNLGISRGFLPKKAGSPLDWGTGDWTLGNEPADDELWNKHVCKGTKLLKAMQASESDAGQFFTPPEPVIESEWSATESIYTWGWHDFWGDYFGVTHFNKEAFASLGLPIQAGRDHKTQMEVVQLNHFTDEFLTKEIDKQTYVVDQRTYRNTGGMFRLAINTGVGAIVGVHRVAPAVPGLADRKPPITGDELPKLQRSSDIMGILWLARASDPKKLKYFMSQDVINDPTLSTLVRAVGDVELTGWPGIYFSTSFDADGENGRALVGAPNGAGFGYFLAQHKRALGNMYISGVRVYLDTEAGSGPDLIFYVHQEDPANANGMKPMEDMAWHEKRNMSWKRNGTSVVRQHIVRANL